MIRQEDLTPEQIEALQEVANAGVLKNAALSKAQKRLMKLGCIEKRRGGLVVTKKGKLLLPTSRR